MSGKLRVALAWAEKAAKAVMIAVPAIEKIISIFGDDSPCIELHED